MKRAFVIASLLFVAVALAACGAPSPGSGQAGPGSGDGTATPAAGPYTPIKVDEARAKVAAGSLSAALAKVAESARSRNKEPVDVTGATPVLVACVLQARVADQVVLLEVRADGRAYEPNRYPVPPNPPGLKWKPAADSQGAKLAEPSGSQELAAAAAVSSIVKTAKPGTESAVKVYGYTFYWMKADGQPVRTSGGVPFSVTVDPTGKVASWTF